MKESQLQFRPLQVQSCSSLEREREKILYGMTIKQFSHPNLIMDVVGVFLSLEALSCVFLFLLLPSLGFGSVFPRAGNHFKLFSIICPSTIGNF